MKRESTWRKDLGQLTTSELAFLVGCKVGTVKIRLSGKLEPTRKDGRTVWWDSKRALPILFKIGDGLNPQAEKAALDKARREAQELKTAQERGELVKPSGMDRVIFGLGRVLGIRIRSLGMSVASKVAAESKPAACKAIIDDAAREILSDLETAAKAAEERLRRRGDHRKPRTPRS